jgi:hypothetical protein
MSKKHHGGPAPVPPGNRSNAGPTHTQGTDDAQEPVNTAENQGEAFQEQDPKRRLGGYETAGEHPRQQPSRLNDGETHSQ